MKRTGIYVGVIVSLLSFCGCAGNISTTTGAEAEAETKAEIETKAETDGNAEIKIDSSAQEEALEETKSQTEYEVIVYDMPLLPMEPKTINTDKEVKPVVLAEESVTENGISTYEEWMEENSFQLPQKILSYKEIEDDRYRFFLDETSIEIFDKEKNQTVYRINFQENMGDAYGNWACIEDDILYMEKYYNGYAAKNSAYLLAIDLKTGSLLWRSADQTCNSRNFYIVGDVILCGYGFTAEDDYIYQINKYTGEVTEQLKIAKMADYFMMMDDKLYVHTYDRDYVYHVSKEQ